jgi:MoaA/NifB/PqqE/SkfB family radical SAM enzyme
MEFVPDFPLQLNFELNYSCNFSCCNCTWSAETTRHNGRKTWFPFEVYKQIIDESVPKGLRAVRLNYLNEPLLRPDIIRFIEYARKAGVLDIYFSTNGSLLSEEMSRALIKAGLLRLQVSLDATTKETYDKIRIGGDFNSVKENIERFLTIRKELGTHLPALRVNFVKCRENERELQDFLAYWELKAETVGVQDLVNVLGDHDKLDDRDELFKCSQPFVYMAIRYDGTILPCCSFFGAETPIARLKTDVPLSSVPNIGLVQKDRKDRLEACTIEEAWHSPAMNLLREIHRNDEYWHNPVCKKCVLSTSHSD